MVLGEWMGSNFNHCDRQWSCDLPRHDKTSSPYPRQLVYLIAGCGRSVCRVSILSTPVRRQILLHRRPHPCWCLFQGQLRLLVLLQHQSLRHDGRPLPCHHKAFAVHVLHDERNCWVMIITVWNGPFLFFFLPSVFTYNHNPTFTMFVEISRVLIFQILPLVIFVAATSHLLRIAWKVNRQTRELISQVRHNHAMNMSGQNTQRPAVFRVQHRSSTVLIILVMTAFNITYLGGNYRCLCFLTNLCPFAGTLRYMVYLVLIANTAVNPVLYSFFKSDIQKELFKLFSR